MKWRLVVAAVGHLNIDIYVKVERMPEPDAREIAEEMYLTVGGAATNYSIAVTKLGVKSILFATCGRDLFGEYALSTLSRLGVDTRYVRQVDASTGVVLCILDSRGVKYMIANEGANKYLETPSTDTLVRENVSHVHIVLSSFEKLTEILSKLKDCDVSISIGLRTQIAREGLHKLCKLLDMRSVNFLFLNISELYELVGSKDLEYCVEELVRNVNAEEIIITLGDRGSIIVSKRFRINVPAYRIDNVVDTTGAGDVYAAIYTVLRLFGIEPAVAARVASAYSGLKCTMRGASSIPSPADVLNFLKSRDDVEAYNALHKVLNECLNIST